MSHRRPSGHRFRAYDDVPKHLRCGRCCRRIKMHGFQVCEQCDREVRAWARRVNREDDARQAAKQGSAI